MTVRINGTHGIGRTTTSALVQPLPASRDRLHEAAEAAEVVDIAHLTAGRAA